METWRAISTIRAVRAFADRPLDEAHVERIIRAGRRAPSSKNRQRWEFVVCRERAHLVELSKVGDFAGHVAAAAAAVAVITPDADNRSAREWTMLDAGQAAQNMLLTAWDLEIGGVHAAVYDEPLASRLLGYPAGYRCDLILSLGYPADPTVLTAPLGTDGRRPLDELVPWERW